MKVHWIGLDTPGRLGISRRPDGGEALDGQMATLAYGMVDHVVSLLEPAEAADLGLADEGGAAERNGIGFYNFPITDHGIPADVVHYRRLANAVARIEANPFPPRLVPPMKSVPSSWSMRTGTRPASKPCRKWKTAPW